MENCDFSILEEISSPDPSALVSFEDPSVLSTNETRALEVILGAHLADSGQRERGGIGEILGKSFLCAMCEHFREARGADLRRLLTGLCVGKVGVQWENIWKRCFQVQLFGRKWKPLKRLEAIGLGYSGRFVGYCKLGHILLW